MKIVEEQILFECLEQFEAGVSVEKLVAKYPHAAAEIEKFLATAAHLQQLKLQPGLAAKRQSQRLFLQEAANLRVNQHRAWFSWRTLRRTLLPVASLAMVAILVATTFLFASASALPGDLLYDAKRWMESYQLEQAGDATAVFDLNAQMSQERMREVKAILRTDKTADVSFAGLINTKQGNNWIIAGVPVKVNGRTQVEGYASVGAMVQVNGRTQNGHLYASSIIVLQEAPATATPTSTATPIATETTTVTPINTTTNTPTPTATVTTSPTVSATPTATSTPTKMPLTPTAVPPTATSEPTSVPTAVTNDDNDNENSDGGSNDNSGDDNSNDNDNSGSNSGNNNSGDDNGNSHSGNDNSGGNNGNENSGNENDNNNDDNSGSGSGHDNNNGNDDNSNDNGRSQDD